MTDTDKAEFAVIMSGLAENFSAEVSKPGLQLRFQAFIEFSIEEVRSAAMACIKSRKYTKMPTVADLLEFMGGGKVEDRAEVEAAKVLKAISEHGSWKSICFDDPVTQAVIKQGFQGWPKLCEDVKAAETKWFIKDFVRMYGAYSRQRIEVYGHLHGTTALQGGVVNRIEKVGDRKKAQLVLDAARDWTDEEKGLAETNAKGAISALITSSRHRRAAVVESSNLPVSGRNTALSNNP